MRLTQDPINKCHQVSLSRTVKCIQVPMKLGPLIGNLSGLGKLSISVTDPQKSWGSLNRANSTGSSLCDSGEVAGEKRLIPTAHEGL